MFRYAEGKRTITEVIGHLLDTERVFAYRLLRISRGDVTELTGFDETTYAPEGQFNHPHGLVSGVRMVSARALGLLSTLFWGTRRIIVVSSGSAIGCPRLDDDEAGQQLVEFVQVLCGHVERRLVEMSGMFGVFAARDYPSKRPS
jgi:hypothetical protein